MGASNSARTGSSTPRTARTRLTRRVANSECPPNAKKSSVTATALAPRTSANRSHRTASTGEEVPPSPAVPGSEGTGSFRRSTLPLAVKGTASISRTVEGTMTSGRRRARKSRSSPPSRPRSDRAEGSFASGAPVLSAARWRPTVAAAAFPRCNTASNDSGSADQVVRTVIPCRSPQVAISSGSTPARTRSPRSVTRRAFGIPVTRTGIATVPNAGTAPTSSQASSGTPANRSTSSGCLCSTTSYRCLVSSLWCPPRLSRTSTAMSAPSKRWKKAGASISSLSADTARSSAALSARTPARRRCTAECSARAVSRFRTSPSTTLPPGASSRMARSTTLTR